MHKKSVRPNCQPRDGLPRSRRLRYLILTCITMILIPVLMLPALTSCGLPVPDSGGKARLDQFLTEGSQALDDLRRAIDPAHAPSPTPDSEPEEDEGRTQGDSQDSSKGVPELVTALSSMITFRIADVSDGDTLRIDILGRRQRLRLIGVNCPEIAHPDQGIEAQPYGEEAAEFTRDFLDGRDLWLSFDREKLDRYGRPLVYVWLDKPLATGDTNIPEGLDEEQSSYLRQNLFNAILIREGWARAYNKEPNSRYKQFFKQLEEEAKAAGKGIWQE